MSHAVVIVDDEPPARAKIARYLEPLEDFHIAAQAGSVAEALDALAATRPAVVFLDVQLGTGTGFDVLRALPAGVEPLIVFTTAYSQYAVQAFEVQALDYLLKPYDRDRFMASIARLREDLKAAGHDEVYERMRRLLAALPGQPALPRRLLIRQADRALFVEVDAIGYLSAAGNYVEVHEGTRVHLVRDTLARVIATLDPAEFIRVHRSHVVRLGYIAELHPLFHGDYELTLKDGTRLPLSRRYKALLPAALRERL